MTAKAGRVRIVDVGCYPNLAPAMGASVGCQVEELYEGCFVYHVAAHVLIDLGCDVDGDNKPFPFYSNEVEVIL